MSRLSIVGRGGGEGGRRLTDSAAREGMPFTWSGWRPLPLIGVALALALLVLLDRRADILWTPVPLWVVGMALVATLLMLRRVPLLVAALWGLGMASYAWSLTPGDTLLAALWGLVTVALAAAGRTSGVLLLALAFVELRGLESALALNQFGLESYRSGSVHYLLGAKSLVVLAPALVGFVRSRRAWLTAALWALATVAVYGALMSGSRGVYLPLVVILLVVTVRLLRKREGRVRVVVGLLLAAVCVVAADRVLPGHPVAEALFHKASLHMQESAVSQAGSFTQRLRFWDQGLAMARAHPLGVGLGGFRGTIHAFQRFPMVWSSSPHDVFVETVSTVGWPGLGILLLLLASAFWRAWRSPRWPWALALFGIWFHLAVDVTADYPSILAVAFAAVGACLGSAGGGGDSGPTAAPGWNRPRAWLAGLVVVAGSALAVWWFVPCSGPMCAVTRWRGVEYRAVSAARQIPSEERPAYFARLEKLYPVSLWVLEVERAYAPTLDARLALTRRIAERYPLQSWRNYQQWAELSLQAGDRAQALEAVDRGLKLFGPDSARYPEARADPAGYRAWLEEAKRIEASTSSPAPTEPSTGGGAAQGASGSGPGE
ncbi:MAG TPA: O-antigen ligase family protein [Trueperaceae bacterium]|nr:O-antigen ligase family protein [Trueperaceae bacterium]